MKRLIIILKLILYFMIPSMSQEVKIDNIQYKIVAPEEAEVSFGANANGNIVIPATIQIGGQVCRVVGIGRNAFSSMQVKNSRETKLTGITLSDNIRYIGESAFFSCKYLKHITIPNSVQKIGEHAFGVCDLQEIELPNSIDSVGYGCFSYNHNLKKIILPNKKTIAFYASGSYLKNLPIFDDCEAVEAVIGSMEILRLWESEFDYECPFLRKYRADKLKSFSYYAYSKVAKRLAEWQKKKEFETTGQWKQRVTQQTREKQLAIIMEDERKTFIDKNTLKNIKGNLGTYNADNEIFPVNISGINKELYVQVPTTDAPYFKQKWNNVIITPQYGIVDDQIAVLSCSFQLGEKTYKSAQNYINDNFSDMELPPLEMDFSSVNDKISSVAQQNTIKKENNKLDYSMDNQIPVTNANNDRTFTVITGNEYYQRVTNVDFAQNDAKIFAAYCQKTLGIPEKNIRNYANATYGTMLAALKDIRDIADAYNGDINVIFYYAGHGIPDGKGNAYLLPVDADGTQPEVCLPTSRLYQKLNELNAKKIVIFMDACFSGAQRGEGMLIAARGVAIKSISDVPGGNCVVFCAANGEETAYPYKEKGHGMFTYFLLKKLQETKGDVTLGELAEYITSNVGTQSVVVNRKKQTPTIVPSIAANNWQSMTLK